MDVPVEAGPARQVGVDGGEEVPGEEGREVGADEMV